MTGSFLVVMMLSGCSNIVKDNLCYYLMENNWNRGLVSKEDLHSGELFNNMEDTNWFCVVNDCIFLS